MEGFCYRTNDFVNIKSCKSYCKYYDHIDQDGPHLVIVCKEDDDLIDETE